MSRPIRVGVRMTLKAWADAPEERAVALGRPRNGVVCCKLLSHPPDDDGLRDVPEDQCVPDPMMYVIREYGGVQDRWVTYGPKDGWAFTTSLDEATTFDNQMEARAVAHEHFTRNRVEVCQLTGSFHKEN